MRKILALLAAYYGVFIFPFVLILFHVEQPLAGQLLVYMTTILMPPIGAYLYCEHRKDVRHEHAVQG